jgi:hypothetical protein
MTDGHSSASIDQLAPEAAHSGSTAEMDVGEE